VRRSDGAVVGEVGDSLDTQTGTAQVGYSIVEPCWGRGLATAALCALLGHLGADPRVRRVVAETLVEHRASRRVMEKAGMRECDERLGEEDGCSSRSSSTNGLARPLLCSARAPGEAAAD
jgi:RimJ/RimL family protein N-acetyltransferase